MNSKNVLAMVLAGGEGIRLRPLTANQAKPAVPFVAGYRIVDFVLGNLVNSGIASIHVLGQYKPASLIEHVESTWGWFNSGGRVMKVLVPGGSETFRGTADAVYRNLWLIEHRRPDVVAVFAADHVYRMDVRQMIAFHREQEADVTVAALPVPVRKASQFGVISVDACGRMRRFEEKPASPQTIPGDDAHALASMGNYLFKADVLRKMLEQVLEHGGNDFGRDMMPFVAQRGWRALAYDFARNKVPGVQPYEEPAYWRDVGTLEALADAKTDVRGPTPRFDLGNRLWPIRRDHARPSFPERKDARRVARNGDSPGAPRSFPVPPPALHDLPAESALPRHAL